jgi:hypothetical protein
MKLTKPYRQFLQVGRPARTAHSTYVVSIHITYISAFLLSIHITYISAFLLSIHITYISAFLLSIHITYITAFLLSIHITYISAFYVDFIDIHISPISVYIKVNGVGHILDRLNIHHLSRDCSHVMSSFHFVDGRVKHICINTVYIKVQGGEESQASLDIGHFPPI